ncbi:major facilitator superfamily [Heterobasidion irregulare TC 32-1]|uniref:Major facilitator superfamily n=1 Tax=Heterobasidion irregulare (strain TC 32-1) TaxID=747525 RepID=W4JQZ8_HETIT|nr:major facilitator superfamily [Heterobasidion irregulare TC 32-1]ETW75515.1 major facilitator superfamily [Heterobasidion irregulare TC 32-1]
MIPGLPPQPPADSNLVTWDGPNDPENPQNWSHGYKWAITVLMSLMTLNVTFASSAPSSASLFIAAEFRTTQEVSYLITSIFLIGYVLGPLLWGPGSEVVGRKLICTVALTLYTIFHLGQALAHNIETLLVTRFLSGFFACAPLTVGGGFIADVWDPVGRGPSTSMFSTTVFLGPVLGPIVSGFIVESYLGWRWVFWVMMMFAGACTILAILFMPETYAPVILLRKARRLRIADPERYKDLYAEAERQKWSFKELMHRTILRPFKMLLQEPILVIITIYMSIVYGLLYALFEAFPIVFVRIRGLTISQDGLIFIGVGIGTTIGASLNYYFSRDYPRLMKEWRGFPPAEERLYGAMMAGPCLVIGIFWLGWTGAYASVPWYVPALSTILIGMSVSLVFISFLSYLVDTYLMYSASAFAANTMIRSIVGAAFPLFTVQMFEGMGVQWAATLIGCVGIVLAPMPFLFYKYGPRIRQNSKFAPCLDLKIAKEIEDEQKAEREKGAV